MSHKNKFAQSERSNLLAFFCEIFIENVYFAQWYCVFEIFFVTLQCKRLIGTQFEFIVAEIIYKNRNYGKTIYH